MKVLILMSSMLLLCNCKISFDIFSDITIITEFPKSNSITIPYNPSVSKLPKLVSTYCFKDYLKSVVYKRVSDNYTKIALRSDFFGLPGCVKFMTSEALDLAYLPFINHFLFDSTECSSLEDDVCPHLKEFHSYTVSKLILSKHVKICVPDFSRCENPNPMCANHLSTQFYEFSNISMLDYYLRPAVRLDNITFPSDLMYARNDSIGNPYDNSFILSTKFCVDHSKPFSAGYDDLHFVGGQFCSFTIDYKNCFVTVPFVLVQSMVHDQFVTSDSLNDKCTQFNDITLRYNNTHLIIIRPSNSEIVYQFVEKPVLVKRICERNDEHLDPIFSYAYGFVRTVSSDFVEYVRNAIFEWYSSYWLFLTENFSLFVVFLLTSTPVIPILIFYCCSFYYLQEYKVSIVIAVIAFVVLNQINN